MSEKEPLRIAYADPPYLGQAARRYGDPTYDNVDEHASLFRRLDADFDGWAYSLGATMAEVKALAPYFPDDARLGAWVKPFAVFKPGVNPAYAFELVVFKPARRRGRDLPTVRDWVSANITLKKGLTGAKPEAFSFWIFEILGAQPHDEFVDLFPGTGAVTEAWKKWCELKQDA